MRDRRKNDEAALQSLRLGALRVTLCREHPDGPSQDINPHSADPQLSAYALASMLVVGPFDRVAHRIYAGRPEHVQPRLDWALWEMGDKGCFTTQADHLATEVAANRAGSREREH